MNNANILNLYNTQKLKKEFFQGDLFLFEMPGNWLYKYVGSEGGVSLKWLLV